MTICPMGNSEEAGHVYWDWNQAIGLLKCLKGDLDTTWREGCTEPRDLEALERTIASIGSHIEKLEKGRAAFQRHFGRPPISPILSKKPPT